MTTTTTALSGGILGDYDRIAEAALTSDRPFHNLGILKSITGGTELALSDPVELDMGPDYRQRIERMFVVSYLSHRFLQWPAGEAEQYLADFALRLATQADELRASGKLTAQWGDKEYLSGQGPIFDSIRTWIQGIGPQPHWTELKVQREHAPTASQSLELFLDDLQRDGVARHERSLGHRMRWFCAIGARDLDQLERRQRFFAAYRNALMSHNSYRRAGSQFFGPIIGNTSTTVFLDILDKWRDGASLEEAPLIATNKNRPGPEDHSSNNVVRELWGFFNLDKQPFYNSRAAVYRSVHSDPDEAVRQIGRATGKWLDGNDSKTAQLAARFDELLDDSSVQSTFRRYPVRRWRKGGRSEFDVRFYDDLMETASRVLKAKSPKEKAAVLLHLTLDGIVYEDTLEPDGDLPPGPGSNAGGNDHEPDSELRKRLDGLRDHERVWIYAPGRKAGHWDQDLKAGQASIDYQALGHLGEYKSADEILEALREVREGDSEPSGEARTCWRFAHEIQIGDPIIARRGRSRIIGLGVVTTRYAKVEDEQFGDRIGVDWLWSGDYIIKDKRSLPRITLSEASRRKALLQELETYFQLGEDEGGGEDEGPEPYSRSEALSDLFIVDDVVDEMIGLLHRKKNLVIQGPPGVGKTFVAKRLAYLLLEARDESRLRFVQFHQAYTYEQFVRGYRPDGEGGFELANGPLYELAETAKSDPDQAYVLIIDEINRGNLSKILGEGMLLLEPDKRSDSWALQLAYTRSTADDEEEPFYLPPNLYVIGTMNTADRSLAVVDYALRRRFSFVDLTPGFDHPRFGEHVEELPQDLRADLLLKVRKLNKLIQDDPNLGDGFQIGHSYFCRGDAGEAPWAADAERWLDDILRYELLPLLREYWYDDRHRLEQAGQILGLGAP